MRKIALLLLAFVVSPAQAVDSRLFPYLYRPGEIFSSETLEARHYEYLKRRFENSDFDEILFKESSARSERLTRENHKQMFEALKNFMEANKEKIDAAEYLAQRPALAPFRIAYADGKAEAQEFMSPESRFAEWLSEHYMGFLRGEFLRLLSPKQQDELVRLMSKKFPGRFASMMEIQPSALIMSPELLEAVMHSFTALYRLEATEQTLQALTYLVAAHWVLDSNLRSTVRTISRIHGHDEFRLKSAFQSQIAGTIQELQLPGKLANNFWKYAGLEEAPPPKEAKGITARFMSRWDASFKGIGPGECIRASCNRFFDALYPDALHIALNEGDTELGYVSIYRVQQKEGRQMYWYVDAIQSPGITSPSGSTVILEELILHLQRLAMREGALLAFPLEDWNATNFKMNVSVMNALGRAYETEVSYLGGDIQAAIYEFVKADGQKHHQELMSKSGYTTTSKMMYDSLYRNNYKVRVAAPLPGLSVVELEQMLAINGKNVQALRASRMAANENVYRAQLLAAFESKSPALVWQMYSAVRAAQLFFNNNEAGKAFVSEKLFPTALLRNPEGEQLHGQLIEKLLLAKEPRRIFELLKNTDWAKADQQWSEIVTEIAVPKLAELNYGDWPRLMEEQLKHMHDLPTDLRLATAVLPHIQSFKDFVSFTRIITGNVTGAGSISDRKERETLVTANFPRFAEMEQDTDKLIAQSNDVLNSISSPSDVRVRKALLTRARSFEDIAAIMKLSNPPNKEDMEAYGSALAGAAAKLIPAIADIQELFTRLDQVATTSASFTRFAIEKVIPVLEKLGYTDWNAFYGKILPKSPSDAGDVLLAAAVYKRLKTIEELMRFLDISHGKVQGQGRVGDKAELGRLSAEIYNKVLRAKRADLGHLIATKYDLNPETRARLGVIAVENAESFRQAQEILSGLKSISSAHAEQLSLALGKRLPEFLAIKNDDGNISTLLNNRSFLNVSLMLKDFSNEDLARLPLTLTRKLQLLGRHGDDPRARERYLALVRAHGRAELEKFAAEAEPRGVFARPRAAVRSRFETPNVFSLPKNDPEVLKGLALALDTGCEPDLTSR